MDINNILHNIALSLNRIKIIANIQSTEKKIIGYDFDGVLHTDVTLADSMGQKHPTNWHGPYTPFDKIINQIKDQLLKNYEIYIVTARSDHSKPQIDKFLKDNGLPMLSNKVYYTHNQDKTVVLNGLKINEFYDDSCLRIKQLYTKMAIGQLPQMSELYLVYPETKTWVNVHKNNQAKKDCGIPI